MNRTSEFFKYIQEENPNLIRQTMYQPRKRSKFSEIAEDTNIKIEESSQLCQQLYDLVNGDNVLGENDREIGNLITQLKNNIEIINVKIGQIEGMSRESPLASSVAQNLRNSLMEISDEFNKVVKRRAEKAKEQQTRRSKYGAYTPSSHTYDTVYANDDEVEIPINDMVMEENLNERYGLVRGVEASIASIAEMMSSLSVMIASQDLSVARIDENTTLALENMKKGELEMNKYWQRTKNDKWFILKVFAVLFAFACIFILIV